jgi:hypothetical protein
LAHAWHVAICAYLVDLDVVNPFEFSVAFAFSLRVTLLVLFVLIPCSTNLAYCFWKVSLPVLQPNDASEPNI